MELSDQNRDPNPKLSRHGSRTSRHTQRSKSRTSVQEIYGTFPIIAAKGTHQDDFARTGQFISQVGEPGGPIRAFETSALTNQSSAKPENISIIAGSKSELRRSDTGSRLSQQSRPQTVRSNRSATGNRAADEDCRGQIGIRLEAIAIPGSLVKARNGLQSSNRSRQSHKQSHQSADSQAIDAGPKHLVISKGKATNVSSSRKNLMMVDPDSLNIAPQPLSQDKLLFKQRKQPNQFKRKSMNDREVIEYLFEKCAENLTVNTDKQPGDFDSTNALDSFLESIILVVKKNYQMKDLNTIFNQLHLATGTRTPFCQEVLTYIIKHQSKETILCDSVEFFQEALEQLIQVQGSNAERGRQLNLIGKDKTELTTQKFDLTRKLSYTSQQVLKLRQADLEQVKLIAALKKQLDQKKAECESLAYRLKNHEPTSPSDQVLITDKQSLQMIQLGTNATASMADINVVPISVGTPRQQPLALALPSVEQSEMDQVARQVESDISQLRHALNDRIDSHQMSQDSQIDQIQATFDRLQDNLNKVQIENESLKRKKQTLSSKVDSKDRLVRHLENKVTQIMVEKEENQVKMKSEIVLLQNKIDQNEEQMHKKLNTMRDKLSKEAKANVKSLISELEGQIDDGNKRDRDQKAKLKRVHEDYKALQEEFGNYRDEKLLQEEKRDEHVLDIEKKLTSLSKIDINMKQKLEDKVCGLEQQLDLNQKETQIVYLRLRYLRQTAETLYRQKEFLNESLSKAKIEFAQEMTELKDSLLSQNKNHGYLISVAKSIKQTQRMADLGTQSLDNIEHIVGFFKIEKLYSLIFNEEPKKGQGNAKVASSAHSHTGSEDTNRFQQARKHVPRTQQMLDDLKTRLDLPVNFRPKLGNKANASDAWMSQAGKSFGKMSNKLKSEDYYLEHCPLEMASVMLKLIVELLVKIGAISQPEQIPHSISRMLYMANQKSDLDNEMDIFDAFLHESKSMLDSEYEQLKIQITTHKELRELGALEVPEKLGLPHFADLRNQKLREEEAKRENRMKRQQQQSDISGGDLGESDEEQREIKDEVRVSFQRSSTQRIEKSRSINGDVSKDSEIKKSKNKGKQHEKIKKLRQDMLKLQMEQDEHKLKAKSLQQSLAMRIVKLEETLEFTSEKNEERLQEAELAYRLEIHDVKKGVNEREVKLLEQVHSLKDRIQVQEQTIDNLQHQNRPIQSRQMLTDNSQNVASPHLEESRDAESVRSHEEQAFNNHYKQIGELQQQLNNFSKNVQSFINIRECNVSMFNLVFEAEETNISLINDAMLIYYLSKSFRIPKEKFQILQTQHFVAEFLEDELELGVVQNTQIVPLQKPQKPVALVKITIELSEDLPNIQRALSLVRAEIRDGSSLLFDLVPVYLGICLGRSGLATRNQLDEFHIVEKVGITMHGKDYIASLMRTKKNPYIFLVMLLNLQHGTEYILELLESDILQLVEGNQGLLEQPEPKELLRMIVRGLDILTRGKSENGNTEIKVLTCEHRIFFNTLWQDVIVSGVQQNRQMINKRSASISKTDIQAAAGQARAVQFLSKQMRTTHRDDRIKGLAAAQIAESAGAQSAHKDMHTQSFFSGSDYDPKFHGSLLKQIDYGVKLRKEMGAQTDFSGSLMYNTSNAVYRSSQKLNEKTEITILINESKKDLSLMLQFQEQSTHQTAKFCLFRGGVSPDIRHQRSTSSLISAGRTLNSHSGLDASDAYSQKSLGSRSVDGQPASPDNLSPPPFNLSGMSQRGTAPKQDPQNYLLHTQVISVEEGHLILISVERIQNDGLLIKLHDTKYLASDQFYLIRKSNGHLTRLNLDANLDLVYKPEFRDMVYHLAFVQHLAGPEIVVQNLSHVQEKMILQGRSPNSASNELFSLPAAKHAGKVQRLRSFKVRAISQYRTTAAAIMQSMTEDVPEDSLFEWKSLQEKGFLLYRDTLQVRCALENRAEHQEALISMHLKDGEVNIEVYLFRDVQKMSITSSVNSVELFGRDPRDLNFRDRIALLHEMLQKLFVIQHEQKFHMKVEADSEPISALLQREKTMQEQAAHLKDKLSSVPRYAGEKYEDMLNEFRMQKDSYLEEGRAKHYSRIVQDGGISYDLDIYFLCVTKPKKNKTQARITTVGKSNIQITAQKIENAIEDLSQFESIYIQTTNPETEDTINVYMDKRRIAYSLASDNSLNWSQIITNWETEMVEYLAANTVVHDRRIEIFNNNSFADQILSSCRSLYCQVLLERSNNPIMGSFPEEQENILDRQLLINQEFDFTEFSFDIKVFRIFNKTRYGKKNLSIGCSETLCYQIEIFNVNEPHVIYKNNYPVKLPSSGVEDPVTIVCNVFNLVNHPFDTIDEVTGKVRNQAQQRHTQKYKALFQRYIDNQLILVVQEEKFPACIKISLAEPCSGLIWRFHHEPNTEIQRAAHFAIIDKGSIESLLTVVLDGVQAEPQILPKKDEIVNDTGDWDLLQNRSFVQDELINDHLTLSIFKRRENLYVQIMEVDKGKKRKAKEEDSHESKSSLSKDEDKSPRKVTTDFEREALLEIQIDHIYGNNLIAKIINQDDAEQRTHGESLFLLIRTSEEDAVISLTKLANLEPVFAFKFEHSTFGKADPYKNCTYTPHFKSVKSLDKHYRVLKEALTQLNTSHMVEQAVQQVEFFAERRALQTMDPHEEHLQQLEQKQRIQTFESLFNKLQKCPAHQSRFYQRNFGEEKTISLHRKIFYDEQKEKLIIATANVTYIQDAQPVHQKAENPMILPYEMDQLVFEILEPDGGQSNLMPVELQDVFSEPELAQFNRRDIGKLKSLARVLLEDRAIIKRQESNNNTRVPSRMVQDNHLPPRIKPDEGDVHSYSLQFSAPGANIDDPMMVQVEHSEEEGTTIQHISDEGEGEAHADMDSAAIDLIRGSMSGVSKNSIIVEDDREQEDESREDSPVLRRPM